MTSNMPIDICGPLPRFRQRQQQPANMENTAALTLIRTKGLHTKQVENNEKTARFSKDELVSILEKYLL